MSRSVEKCNDPLHLPYFTALDRHFARLMLRLAGGDDSELALAAALVSRKTGMGDICLDLRMAGGKPLDDDEDAARGIVLPDGERWIQKLRASDVVGASGEYRPLILDGKGRLYLYRYWQYETRLAGSIMKRAADVPGEVNAALLKEGLNACSLRPAAAGLAADSRGGRRYAAFLRYLRRSRHRKNVDRGKDTCPADRTGPRKRRAAGHHACRADRKSGRPPQGVVQGCACHAALFDDVKSHIPDSASTLHRLLGAVPGSPYFRKRG